MPAEIVNPETPIYLFMLAAWLYTASLLVIAFVLLTRGERMLDAVVASCRRLFSRAGDGCAKCRHVVVSADCQACGTRYLFEPHQTTVTRETTVTRVPTLTRPEGFLNIDRERARLHALAMRQRTTGVM